QKLTAKSGHPPSMNEIAEYMELSVEDVLEAIETSAAHHAVSLDAPREEVEGESETLADSFGEIDRRYDFVEHTASIAAAAGHLSARERRVLVLRFVEDMTQTQIAELIGVSQMQVSRILRRAL